MLNLFKIFWQLIKPFWLSKEKWQASFLLGSIIMSTIFQVQLSIIFNHWNKGFYDSLQAFNKQYILLSLLEFVIILILSIIILTYSSYFNSLLILKWRRWMTDYYNKIWLNKHTSYLLQLQNNVDNPDQRISQDLNELPALTLNLLLGLFNSVLTFISFSIILWQLSGYFSFSVLHKTLLIHGYMFWATLIYASLGTAVMAKLGHRLIALNYYQERFEANFRFGLIRVREFAEQMTLYKGQKTEQKILQKQFIPVFKNFLDIILLQKKLGFFVNGYNYAVQVIGILIALPKYIAEKMSLGVLIQISNAFQNVIGALSFIVYSFGAIANWRAVIWRLTEFNQHMQIADQQINQTKINLKMTPYALIKIKNLNLYLPNSPKRFVIKNFNLIISEKQHVLITGKYGSGKSTLLRALANVWPYGSGTIEMPAGKTLFLPQKPYFPLGTLKQALFYPDYVNKNISDQSLQSILAQCKLEYLNAYLDQQRYWTIEFSLGEQQLIAFARIFIVNPQWVFLDEATSALDEMTEAYIYQLLQKKLPETTIISVGHRSSLKQFHQKEIIIEKI